MVGVETLEDLSRCERLKICKEFICPITKIIIYVNEYGEVFDIYKRLVKQYKDANGYCYIGLRKNLKRKNYKVHRLVAILFIDNPENKPDVNHKDGIKHNNVKANLEWNTKSENMKHAVRTNLLTNCKQHGEYHNTAKVKFSTILKIREDYKNKVGSMRTLAENYNLSVGYISDVVNLKIRIDK